MVKLILKLLHNVALKLCHSACDVLISLPNEMTTFKGTGQMRHERNENDLLVGA